MFIEFFVSFLGAMSDMKMPLPPPRAATVEVHIDRVTTAVPFPRGMVIVDGQYLALSRGRVRSSGGVSAAVEDRAGTLWVIDPTIAEPADAAEPSDAVRTNAIVFAEPTDPPFKLWDRTSNPPQSDRRTDRPYCVLRFDPASRNLFICAFSGIDLARQPGMPSFSKNASDGLLRFDLRTKTWHEVERHDSTSDNYPHHDPATNDPPHGLLKGPNNCLVVGSWLYAVGKDNDRLARYDLSGIIADPNASAPPGEIVLESALTLEDGTTIELRGHSALAEHDGWLYLATRTSGHVVRLKLEGDDVLVPHVAQLVARFDPWDASTGRTADITDLAFDTAGRLHVLNAEPLRVHRFTPDPKHAYEARTDAPGTNTPWLDVAERLAKPKLKGENLFIDDAGHLYLTTGDGYSYQAGAEGTVYRVHTIPAD